MHASPLNICRKTKNLDLGNVKVVSELSKCSSEGKAINKETPNCYLRFVIILFRLNLPLFCYEIGSNMYLFIPFNRTVNPSGALDFTPVVCGVRIVRSLIFCVMFCRPLLVYLSFMFSSLCCLFFDLWVLVIPLISLNLSLLQLTLIWHL